MIKSKWTTFQGLGPNIVQISRASLKTFPAPATLSWQHTVCEPHPFLRPRQGHIGRPPPKSSNSSQKKKIIYISLERNIDEFFITITPQKASGPPQSKLFFEWKSISTQLGRTRFFGKTQLKEGVGEMKKVCRYHTHTYKHIPLSALGGSSICCWFSLRFLPAAGPESGSRHFPKSKLIRNNPRRWQSHFPVSRYGRRGGKTACAPFQSWREGDFPLIGEKLLMGFSSSVSSRKKGGRVIFTLPRRRSSKKLDGRRKFWIEIAICFPFHPHCWGAWPKWAAWVVR